MSLSSIRGKFVDDEEIVIEEKNYVLYERASPPNKDDEELINKKLWFYEPLYKETSVGNVLFWQIGVDLSTGELIMKHGHNGGKIQEDRKKVVPKGKKDIFEQSLQDANTKYKNKYYDGYHIEGDDGIKEPMLAHKYDDHKDKLKFPVGLMVKLDGVRCLVKIKNGKIHLRSRESRSFDHLLPVFEKHFEVLYKYISPTLELDGELYAHHLEFNEIIGLVKSNVNVDYALIQENLSFYLFDSTENLPFENRWYNLYKVYLKYLEEIDNPKILFLNVDWAYDKDEIEEIHRKYVDEWGYEGTMIRKTYYSNQTEKGYKESLYIPGRKTNILKLKDFIDAEGIVIQVKSEGGKNTGAAKFKVRSKDGKEFMCTINAKMDVRKKIYEEREKYIGKIVTYKYFELTPEGVPRFAKIIAIRDYE